MLPSGSRNAALRTSPGMVSTVSAARPAFCEAREPLVEVAHEQRHERLAGALGVGHDIDPARVRELPAELALVGHEVGGTAGEALVPASGGIEVGHGDAGEERRRIHRSQSRPGLRRPERRRAQPAALREPALHRADAGNFGVVACVLLPESDDGGERAIAPGEAVFGLASEARPGIGARLGTSRRQRRARVRP